MSEETVSIDLEKEFASKSLTIDELGNIKRQVYIHKALREQLDEHITGWRKGDSKRHLRLASWVLNRHAELVDGPPTKDHLLGLVQARSLLALGRTDEALAEFTRLGKDGAEEFACQLGKAEAQLAADDAEGGLNTLDKMAKKWDARPGLHYVRGLCLDRLGDYREARAAYERAIELDPEHALSLFRLAFNLDLRGEDDRAMALYERCAELKPTYVNCLLNLGVMYEDRGQYDKATRCFQQVLAANPNHQRARLFLKDATASLDMFFDEDQARRADRQNLILSIPVTDFELSVRSRNCLNKMNIRSLGDLVQKTEQELLSYKNFGETSLMEIKEILSKKGLKLGMGREADARPVVGRAPSAWAGGGGARRSDEADKPLSDFDLSVRVRTALKNLGIETLGELTTRTGRELLAQKNFGQTSLEEVRQLLTKHAMSLADEPS